MQDDAAPSMTLNVRSDLAAWLAKQDLSREDVEGMVEIYLEDFQARLSGPVGFVNSTLISLLVTDLSLVVPTLIVITYLAMNLLIMFGYIPSFSTPEIWYSYAVLCIATMVYYLAYFYAHALVPGGSYIQHESARFIYTIGSIVLPIVIFATSCSFGGPHNIFTAQVTSDWQPWLFVFDLVLRGAVFDVMEHWHINLTSLEINYGNSFFVLYAFLFRMYFSFLGLRALLAVYAHYKNP